MILKMIQNIGNRIENIQETFNNPLNKPYPLGANSKNNRNYEPAACEKDTPNTVS